MNWTVPGARDGNRLLQQVNQGLRKHELNRSQKQQIDNAIDQLDANAPVTIDTLNRLGLQQNVRAYFVLALMKKRLGAEMGDPMKTAKHLAAFMQYSSGSRSNSEFKVPAAVNRFLEDFLGKAFMSRDKGQYLTGVDWQTQDLISVGGEGGDGEVRWSNNDRETARIKEGPAGWYLKTDAPIETADGPKQEVSLQDLSIPSLEDLVWKLAAYSNYEERVDAPLDATKAVLNQKKGARAIEQKQVEAALRDALGDLRVGVMKQNVVIDVARKMMAPFIGRTDAIDQLDFAGGEGATIKMSPKVETARFLLGRRPFTAKRQIINHVETSNGFRGDDLDNAQAMRIHATADQHTWLVATDKRLYVVLDDSCKDAPIILSSKHGKKQLSRGDEMASELRTNQHGNANYLSFENGRSFLYSPRLFQKQQIDVAIRKMLQRTMGD